MLELLKKVLTTVGKKWNVIGLDLKNEPHGAATWGYGQSTTDWNQFAERAIKALASSFDGLFFVEGVEQKAAGQSNEAHFWGKQTLRCSESTRCRSMRSRSCDTVACESSACDAWTFDAEACKA